MNDYFVKLVIGSLCMIILAGILAGSSHSSTPVKNKKPVKPDVVYVIQNGKVIGAASAVPYTEDGNIEQRPVDVAILGEKLNGTDNDSDEKISD